MPAPCRWRAAATRWSARRSSSFAVRRIAAGGDGPARHRGGHWRCIRTSSTPSPNRVRLTAGVPRARGYRPRGRGGRSLHRIAAEVDGAPRAAHRGPPHLCPARPALRPAPVRCTVRCGDGPGGGAGAAPALGGHARRLGHGRSLSHGDAVRALPRRGQPSSRGTCGARGSRRGQSRRWRPSCCGSTRRRGGGGVGDESAPDWSRSPPRAAGSTRSGVASGRPGADSPPAHRALRGVGAFETGQGIPTLTKNLLTSILRHVVNKIYSFSY